MNAKLLSVALSSFLLTGCMGEKSLLQKFIPKNEDTDARHFIELVRTNDLTAAQAMLAPSLQGAQADSGLKQLHGVLDHGEPLEIETIGCDTSSFHSSSENVTRINLSYQIHFMDSWAVGHVLLEKKPDSLYVLGSHFHPVSDSLEVLNRFTLTGKSPLHFIILTCCVMIPVFILYTLVICIRSSIRRKWLWIIFILFGLVELRFDWTSGLYDIKPLSILLFGGGVVQSSPYSPWIFELALPVGAFVFLLRRRKLIAAKSNLQEPTA